MLLSVASQDGCPNCGQFAMGIYDYYLENGFSNEYANNKADMAYDDCVILSMAQNCRIDEELKPVLLF